jgi:hypothetical protein
MKNTFNKFNAFIAGAATLFALCSHASAQTITVNLGNPKVINTINSPTNYDFFSATGGDTLSLPSYATVATAGLPDSSGLTSLTVNSTTVSTGLVYAQGTTTLATITLGSGVPASFTLGVLSDYDETDYYTLNLYDGSGLLSTSGVLNPTANGNVDDQNQFSFATVSNASMGDTIQVNVSGINSGDQVTLGGITFDSVATPEPSTYALMFAGLSMLLLVARLRRTPDIS